VHVLSRVIVALGSVGLAAYLAVVGAMWRTYGILHGLDPAAPNVTGQFRDVQATAVVEVLLSVIAVLALGSAGVGLLIWVWRARGNAELIEPLTSTIELGAAVATAVLAGAIVLRISRWQSESVPAGEL
jgi:hypothetical protein